MKKVFFNTMDIQSIREMVCNSTNGLVLTLQGKRLPQGPVAQLRRALADLNGEIRLEKVADKVGPGEFNMVITGDAALVVRHNTGDVVPLYISKNSIGLTPASYVVGRPVFDVVDRLRPGMSHLIFVDQDAVQYERNMTHLKGLGLSGFKIMDMGEMLEMLDKGYVLKDISDIKGGVLILPTSEFSPTGDCRYNFFDVHTHIK